MERLSYPLILPTCHETRLVLPSLSMHPPSSSESLLDQDPINSALLDPKVAAHDQTVQHQPVLCPLPPTPPPSCPSEPALSTAAEPMAQLAGHSAAAEPSQAGAAYTVREQPLGSARHVRIVGVGAGASGLNLIRTLRLNLSDYEVTIYEKNADVGGTWLENRYPGCRCDVPSHSYQFSWRQKKDWTNFFAGAEEIGDYLCRVCDEEGMRDSIKTLHQVTSAQWNEKDGQWELAVKNLETGEQFSDYATFLVDGTGILK